MLCLRVFRGLTKATFQSIPPVSTPKFARMDVHYQQMCCCILCKLLASLFLFVCRPLHARSSKRSAGEHLDVRLLLILSSAPFFSAHPALSPLSTPLFIPPSVTGQTDEEKCQPPDERERGSEVERQGERPVERETTLSVRSTRRITFT